MQAGNSQADWLGIGVTFTMTAVPRITWYWNRGQVNPSVAPQILPLD